MLMGQAVVSKRGKRAVVGRGVGVSRRVLKGQLSVRNLLVWVVRIAILVVFLGLWQISVNRGWADPFFVSKPTVVWSSLWSQFSSGTVWSNGWATLEATLLGFIIGSAGGVIVGFLIARSGFLDRVLSPYLAIANAMPRVGIAPLFILWFGIGLASKVWFSISLVFFIVLSSTAAGIRSIEQELITVMASMGASERQSFLKVMIPGSVPSIFGGLRLGFTYALLGVVFGEMLASTIGLGHEISVFTGNFDTAGALATLIILGVMAMILTAILNVIEKRLLRWK
jgi:NitT/TauT family transport system permease protein